MIVMAVAECGARADPGSPPPGPQPGAAPEPPKKAVVTTAGPIKVKESISDRTIQQFLAKFLPKYPGVRAGECHRR